MKTTLIQILLFSMSLICGGMNGHAEENVFGAGEFSEQVERKFWQLWYFDKTLEDNIIFQKNEKPPYIHISNSNQNKVVNFTAALRLDPSWKTVKIITKIRTSNYKKGTEAWHSARISLRFMVDDKQSAGYKNGYPPSQPQVKDDNNDWEIIEKVIDVPNGANLLIVQPGLYFATGSADFGDIKIVGLK